MDSPVSDRSLSKSRPSTWTPSEREPDPAFMRGDRTGRDTQGVRSGQHGGTKKKRGGGGSSERSVDEVLASFNTWRFKREQPSDADKLKRIVAECCQMQRAIPFVLYWGKGLRHHVAEPEIQCLDFLEQFSHRIGERHEPGADITILCTDTHARLNGHSPEVRATYFGEVMTAAFGRGFKAGFLSEIVAQFAPIRAGDPSVSEAEPTVELLNQLTRSASKWYLGQADARQAALDYYRMNLIEREAVAAAFPGHVFVTYNSSDFAAIFPDQLPVFYMYSLKKGCRIKPWFM